MKPWTCQRIACRHDFHQCSLCVETAFLYNTGTLISWLLVLCLNHTGNLKVSHGLALPYTSSPHSKLPKTKQDHLGNNDQPGTDILQHKGGIFVRNPGWDAKPGLKPKVISLQFVLSSYIFSLNVLVTLPLHDHTLYPVCKCATRTECWPPLRSVWVCGKGGDSCWHKQSLSFVPKWKIPKVAGQCPIWVTLVTSTTDWSLVSVSARTQQHPGSQEGRCLICTPKFISFPVLSSRFSLRNPCPLQEHAGRATHSRQRKSHCIYPHRCFMHFIFISSSC